MGLTQFDVQWDNFGFAVHQNSLENDKYECFLGLLL